MSTLNKVARKSAEWAVENEIHDPAKVVDEARRLLATDWALAANAGRPMDHFIVDVQMTKLGIRVGVRPPKGPVTFSGFANWVTKVG